MGPPFGRGSAATHRPVARVQVPNGVDCTAECDDAAKSASELAADAAADLQNVRTGVARPGHGLAGVCGPSLRGRP